MKTLLLSLCCLISFTAFSQITPYSDRTAWESAAGDICATEDLERFTEDTDFRTEPLQLNGFTIKFEGSTISFRPDQRNLVDVSPFLSPSINSSSFINAATDFGTGEVVIAFDQPAYGFFADFVGVDGGEMLSLVYDADGTMIDSYNFAMDDENYGITSDVPFTMIKFMSSVNFSGESVESFGMDNIAISCAPPIPSMGQWGLFILGLILSSLAFVFLRSKSTVVA